MNILNKIKDVRSSWKEVKQERYIFMNQTENRRLSMKYAQMYKTKKINIKNIGDYFKILSGKNQGKKMIREIALFHFPIFSYLKYRY